MVRKLRISESTLNLSDNCSITDVKVTDDIWEIADEYADHFGFELRDEEIAAIAVADYYCSGHLTIDSVDSDVTFFGNGYNVSVGNECFNLFTSEKALYKEITDIIKFRVKQDGLTRVLTPFEMEYYIDKDALMTYLEHNRQKLGISMTDIESISDQYRLVNFGHLEREDFYKYIIKTIGENTFNKVCNMSKISKINTAKKPLCPYLSLRFLSSSVNMIYKATVNNTTYLAAVQDLDSLTDKMNFDYLR